MLLALLILALYYWFWVRPVVPVLPKPQLVQPVMGFDEIYRDPATDQLLPPVPPPPPTVVRIDTAANQGRLEVQIGQHIWQIEVPPDFHWNGQRLVQRDACFYHIDGQRIPATGRELYEHVQLLDLTTLVQQKQLTEKIVTGPFNLFYFECQNSTIAGLHVCPAKTFFQDDHCEPINMCLGRANGFQFGDPYEPHGYFRCFNERTLTFRCQPDEEFREGKCRKPLDPCRFAVDNVTYKIDRMHYGKCVGGVTQHMVCPVHTFFVDDRCVSDLCDGRADDERVGEWVDDGVLLYAPAFFVCRGHVPTERTECPPLWNTSEAEHDLTHLPQVFDGQGCTAPRLCENVRPANEHTVVPRYFFSKHLAGWSLGKKWDAAEGFTCDDQNRVKAVPIPPGQTIRALRVEEVECPTPETLWPIAGGTEYFDCATGAPTHCPPDALFDGLSCYDPRPHYFRLEHLDVFRFELGPNNWMLPRAYDSKTPAVTCGADEQLVPWRNACADKACLPLTVAWDLKRPLWLDEEHQCVPEQRTLKRRRVELPEDHTLDFWKQRFVVEGTPPSACAYGEPVQTGDFVLNSTLFQTCDAAQPFVFCPSTDTDGIQQVGSSHACVPGLATSRVVLQAGEKVSMYVKELKEIELLDVNASVYLDGELVTKLKGGIRTVGRKWERNERMEVRASQPVVLHLARMVGNPENVYWENGVGVYRLQQAYCLPAGGSTTKAMVFPEYQLTASVPITDW